jgi:nitrilase
MMAEDTFRIAAVQATPVFLDRDATIDKACELIAEVGANGGRLAVFPEAFVPTYPLWVWAIPASRTQELRDLYAELVDQAVTIPDRATGRLCQAAADAGVIVAIGVNERNAEASGASLYNTLLVIGSDGEVLGAHRKLVPTSGERLVHAQGDGSTLGVWDTELGRLGGLICWENYMPLARYALYAWGAQIWLAPTWDYGEPWGSTLRHIAKEGRVYVVGCCSAYALDAIPDRYAFKERYFADAGPWLNHGDSMIVDPDGKLVAGPVRDEETILYADIDPKTMRGPRWQLDVAGHYGRPDVFQLIVDQAGRPMVRAVRDAPGPLAASPTEKPARPRRLPDGETPSPPRSLPE